MGVAPSRRHCIWVFAERGVPGSPHSVLPAIALLIHLNYLDIATCF